MRLLFSKLIWFAFSFLAKFNLTFLEVHFSVQHDLIMHWLLCQRFEMTILKWWCVYRFISVAQVHCSLINLNTFIFLFKFSCNIVIFLRNFCWIFFNPSWKLIFVNVRFCWMALYKSCLNLLFQSLLNIVDLCSNPHVNNIVWVFLLKFLLTYYC
jgi:hypothetical protein